MRKKQKVKFYDEVAGWLGVASYVVAYLLLTFNYFDSSDLALHIMYLLGAAGIIYHSFKKHDMQPVIVNVFFAIIALTAITNLLIII